MKAYSSKTNVSPGDKKNDIVYVGKETIGVHFNVNIFKDVIMKICCFMYSLLYVIRTHVLSCSVLQVNRVHDPAAFYQFWFHIFTEAYQ